MNKEKLFKEVIDFYFGWEITKFTENDIVVENDKILTYTNIDEALKDWLSTMIESNKADKEAGDTETWEQAIIEFIQSL